MNPPARRDGTPDKKRTHNRDYRGDYLFSNAKPAKHQHVRKRAPKPSADPLADKWWEDPIPDSPSKTSPSDGERLQKVLAHAGVASRRSSEKLIADGRVEVNGTVVTVQGVRVNPDVDIIRVDGVRINTNEDNQYFILNKPRGVLSTMIDDEGRPCIGDLIADRVAAGNRLFHVGRLDADTEGLLLLTNDGELANRLMHPKYEVRKTYLATVKGEAKHKLVAQLRSGIELDDGLAKADYAQVVDSNNGFSIVRVELHEGRKHVVRRMLKEAGFPVQRLVRTKLHTVQLGELKPGRLRALNESELRSLFKAVGM